MSRFSRNKTQEHGVSAIVGVLVLVLLVLVLSAGVLFTANNMLGEQPTDMTAGTTTERITDYEYQTQLVSQGNAQAVEVVSPLGTHYKLTQVGDAAQILAVAPNGNESQVRDIQIIGFEKETTKQVNREDASQEKSEKQVLDRKKVKEGIKADIIVDKYGTGDYKSIQKAVNNAPSATAENPIIIVVEKATYTNNIDVSQNITLIAEHGTIIEDSEPNEPVVSIEGSDSQLRNFKVDSDPKENDNHYASYGIEVNAPNAQLVGNIVKNGSSPDMTSAGISINSANTFVKYNNFNANEQSLHLQSNARSPIVCGNQFSNSIGGYVSQKTKQDLAMNNYWQNGVPTNLVPNEISSQISSDKLLDSKKLPATSTRVPVKFLPQESVAQKAFPGTQLSSDSSGASIESCDVNINFVNTGGSFTLSDIRVMINGQPLVIYQQAAQSSSQKQPPKQSSEPVAVCNCGGDGSYDKGDTISISNPTEQPTQTETTQSGEDTDIDNSESIGESNPITDVKDIEIVAVNETDSDTGGDNTSNSGSNSSSDTVSYTPIDSVEKVPSIDDSSSQESPSETTTSNSDGEEQTSSETIPEVELGSEITAKTGDELVLQPVLTGEGGENTTYRWKFDDGSTASVKTPEHIYTEADIYNVTLTISNTEINKTAKDSITIEIKEGETEIRKIDGSVSDAASVLTNESASYGGKVYLGSGTYNVSEITNSGITIVGMENDVVFENRVMIKKSGVTFKNVEFAAGVSSMAGNVELYNIKASSDSGYAVEIDTDEKSATLSRSSVSSPKGAFINVNDGIVVKDSDITGTDSSASALQFGSRIHNIETNDNTLTANKYGIYVGHRSEMTNSNNKITANTPIYYVKNKAPVVESLSNTTILADMPINFTADVSDPQGDRISHILWTVQGKETVQKQPDGMFNTSFTDAGLYNLTVQPVDTLGKKGIFTKELSVEMFTVSINSSNVTGVEESVMANITTNLPSERISQINYSWGDGTTNEVTEKMKKSHTYVSEGTYDLSVTIKANTGNIATATKQIEVKKVPEFNINIDNPQAQVGETVTFTASNVNVNNPEYNWKLGDNTKLSSKQVSYSYSSPNEYKISLSVTNGPFTVTKTSTVTIGEISNSRILNYDFLENNQKLTDFERGWDGTTYGGIDKTASGPTSVDSAWHFDGQDDRVSIDGAAFEPYESTKSFTITTVLKPDPQGKHRFAYYNWRPNLVLTPDDNSWIFELSTTEDNEYVRLNAPMDGDTWYFAAQSVKNGEYHCGYLYTMDGEIVDKKCDEIAGDVSGNGRTDQNLKVSRTGWWSSNNARYKGSMSSLQIYDTPLTEESLATVLDNKVSTETISNPTLSIESSTCDSPGYCGSDITISTDTTTQTPYSARGLQLMEYDENGKFVQYGMYDVYSPGKYYESTTLTDKNNIKTVGTDGESWTSCTEDSTSCANYQATQFLKSVPADHTLIIFGDDEPRPRGDYKQSLLDALKETNKVSGSEYLGYRSSYIAIVKDGQTVARKYASRGSNSGIPFVNLIYTVGKTYASSPSATSFDASGNSGIARYRGKFTEVVRDNAMMWENRGDYIRFAEGNDTSGIPETKAYIVPPKNDGEITVEYRFKGVSYEGSGAKIYAVDANGDTHILECDSNNDISCADSTDVRSFEWADTQTVTADAPITRVYLQTSVANVAGKWWDEARLYKFEVSK